jgi:hypothetical protein
MALSTSMPRQGTELSIFECPVVIDRGVFAGVSEVQRFTDSIVAETFYETTPWVGGLGEDSPILAGTSILGIAVAGALLGAAAPPPCRLRHRSQRLVLGLREHCSLVQGGLAA